MRKSSSVMFSIVAGYIPFFVIGRRPCQGQVKRCGHIELDPGITRAQRQLDLFWLFCGVRQGLWNSSAAARPQTHNRSPQSA